MTLLTEDDSMLFYAEGPITADVSAECSRILRSRTQLAVGGRILLFGAFVELAQNVARHSDDRTPDTNVGIGTISVERSPTGFILRTVNPVAAAHVADLRSRLDAIRALPPADLNRHYVAQLHQTDQASARSGLGLIDIHRKAAKPPQIELNPTPDGRFSFEVILCIDCA
jgi:hypothetical protein